MGDLPKMLKDEFEKGYAKSSGVTIEDLHKYGQEAVPCDCGEKSCCGWAMQMIDRDQKDDNLCEQCGEPYALRDGEEPTPNCDSCAHIVVSEQQAEIELLKIEIFELKTYVLKIEEELRKLYVSIRETKPVVDVWKEERI
jgi:hypothetical protein